MYRVDFLKSFVKDKQVASVIPSSKFSVKKVCKRIDFSRKVVIVEYGPGTGVFSRYLLNKMTSDSKLILIETNQKLVKILEKINDERILVFNDSAANVDGILAKCGEIKADYIISGIPFSFLKEHQKKAVIEKTYQSLPEEGKFLVYQISFKILKDLESYFGRNIKLDIEVLNIPPLFIMEAIK